VKSFCEAEVSIDTDFRFVFYGKRYFMKKLLLIVALSAGLGIGELKAQEFKLTVVFMGTKVTMPVTFGYDLAASDSMTDTQWGETQPPPFIQPGDLAARMRNFTLGRTYLSADGNDGGPVDIRRKPTQDNFVLQYEMYDTKWDNGYPDPVSLLWDNANIPAIIKHIYLSSEDNGNHKIRLDMRTVSRFDMPDSNPAYSNILITLLYNRETMAVHSNDNNVGDRMTIFPNPMDSRSKLHFILPGESRVMLAAYDITGRKVFEKPINAIAGENTIELTKNDFFAQLGIYLLRLTGSESSNALEKTTTIVVQ
jgi:hypothetical protein